VVTGGIQAEGHAGSVSKGVPTSGRIANGAIVERETGFELNAMAELDLTLRNPDFTTALRIAEVINKMSGQGTAKPKDHATIHLRVPEQYRGNTMAFITDIEQLRVIPDQTAKVIIDENNGVIVMGQDVRISSVAISQGNLTIKIMEAPQVSQPNPFTNGGKTVVVPRTNITVDGSDGTKMTILPEGVTLQQLVDGLNALGVSPRDMITILRTIKAAGALQAEIGAV
jgi:flagellar P-ring protein precursor FlgI